MFHDIEYIFTIGILSGESESQFLLKGTWEKNHHYLLIKECLEYSSNEHIWDSYLYTALTVMENEEHCFSKRFTRHVIKILVSKFCKCISRLFNIDTILLF